MNIDVIIPIRAYLKQFISYHTSTEPFILRPTKCHWSKCIMEPFLNEARPSDDDVHNTDDELTVRFCDDIIAKRQLIIDAAITRNINLSLKSMFDQQLCDFITMQLEKKGDIKLSALAFLEFYDISEDQLTWDAVNKMYYRARTYAPPIKQKRMDEVIAQLKIQFPST